MRVCADHFEYDDPDIAGMYPGERLEEALRERERAAARAAYYTRSF